MHVHEAAFIKSAAQPSGWPPPTHPEIAFCGRSNVGKSTLLNALLGKRGLARVSNTPGRTRLINFFSLQLRMGAPVLDVTVADLPGFGYAKVSKTERATWRPLIQSYLTHRENLGAVVLLCDSRRAVELKKEPDLLLEEQDLCQWLREMGRQVVPVMTKADKLAKHERKPAAEALRRLLHVAPVVFSALSGEGTDELWRRLHRALVPGEPARTEAREGGAP